MLIIGTISVALGSLVMIYLVSSSILWAIEFGIRKTEGIRGRFREWKAKRAARKAEKKALLAKY